MTTIASLVQRIQFSLQDPDGTAWPSATILTQLLTEMQRLSRQQLFGNVAWRQGIMNQPQYVFDDTTVAFREILYNGKSLRPVNEDGLTFLKRDWERTTPQATRPQFYTMDLQAPQTLRLVPAPLLTGDATPTIPAVPLPASEVNNLVAYTWENPQGDQTTFFAPVLLEDVIVFRVVGELCDQQSEFSDKQKAACFKALAQMMLEATIGG